MLAFDDRRRLPETAAVTDTEHPPGAAPAKPLIEIVVLGGGPRGFRALRLDGEDQADAILLMDLHSTARVRIGTRVYDESDADIRVVDD